jgi:VWFA-related protein
MFNNPLTRDRTARRLIARRSVAARWLFTILAATVASGASSATQGTNGARPMLRIISPGEDTFISGATLLSAAADPHDLVASVVFFANGKQVCSVTRPPFQCDWDAGPVVVEHQIRVVARLAGGGQVVKTARTKGAGYSESVDVDVVQVPATVTDDGRFVHGLPATAFRVFEDGKPQTITSLTDSTAPLDLVVAVDISGSMRDAMKTVKEAAKEFLAAVPTKDTVTLLGFNDNIFTVAQRVTDLTKRKAAVDRLAPWGGTALYDVILHSIELLGSRTGRKAIVVFSDGEDQGSQVTLEQVERRLQECDATLYMIGQGRGTSQAGLKRVMQRLATPTGGRALFAERIETLKEVFTDLLEELSNQYLLGYPSTNDKHDGTWRKITVQVEGRNHVRARQGYRAKGSK